MATSSASLAASILKDLSGVSSPAAKTATAAPAMASVPVPVPIPLPAMNPDMRPPPLTPVEYIAEGDGWGYGDDDYDDSMPFDRSGQVTHLERLRGNFALYGLEMSQVLRLMNDTSMVIGGGFMVNHILAMNGLDKPLCPAADLDFYVFDGIPPIYTGAGKYDGKEYREHLSKSIQARAFRRLVTRRFYELVSPLGYTYTYPHEEDYEIERTETGDRVFTSGSNIRMSVLYYAATINGVKKHLNLVFCDTDMYTFISKVDISLTAGFFCPSAFAENFDYHHAAPNDVINHRLTWLQPESTHTERQKARMAKYRERYDLLEEKRMTTTEFVRDWDSLPDEHMHVTLVGTEDEIYSTPVIRRVQGLPRLKFSVEMKLASLLGDCTTYCRFPTPAEIADHKRLKERAAVAPATYTGVGKRPGLVVHDDDEDA